MESAFVQPWSTGQWMDTIFVVGSVWPLPEQIERVAIVEAPIDALSLAAIENMRRDTLYVATGGGIGPGTRDALRAVLISLRAAKSVLVIAAVSVVLPWSM